MSEIITAIKMCFGFIGLWLGYFLGDMDTMLIALLVFIALDYITGVLCGIIDKKLSSEIGFKGIAKKFMIILIIGACTVLDRILGLNATLRTGAIMFYCVNELISITENASHAGLPLPKKLKDILEQLRNETD